MRNRRAGRLAEAVASPGERRMRRKRIHRRNEESEINGVHNHEGHHDHEEVTAVRLAAKGGRPRCTRAQIQTALTPSAACICALVHRGCRRATRADQSNGLSSVRLRGSVAPVKTVPSVPSAALSDVPSLANRYCRTRNRVFIFSFRRTGRGACRPCPGSTGVVFRSPARPMWLPPAR